MGLYYLNIPGKTAEAIDTLEKALAINPSLINASLWLQISYGAAGRSVDAIQILEQMNQRDPLFRPGIANLNSYYLARRELAKAQAMVDKVRPFMPNDPFLLRMEAGIQYANGNAAKALILNERALEIQPDNGPNIAMLGTGLMSTGQFERLAEEANIPWQRTVALWVLGRTEEATILARELANSGEDVTMLIGLLVNSGRQEEAIRFFEERWDSLDTFEEEYPPLGKGDINSLLDLAFAYSSVGNAERFDEAMAHARSAFDAARELGLKDPFFTFSEAVYFTLAGERAQALVLLSDAVDRGLLLGTKLSFAWNALEVLEGDPEYEAIETRMFEHMNAERAELGLEPVG
jgi:tetratricopeptide (TPR) repeat protein